MSARRTVVTRVPLALAAAAVLALATLAPTTAEVSPAASRLLRRADATRIQAASAQPASLQPSSVEIAGSHPEESGIDKDALRRGGLARAKSGGPPHPMSCGDLSLVLDGFGGFGSASAGGDATFDAGDGPQATVFESMVHLRNAGFLDADSMMLPQSEAHSASAGGEVTASYVRGPFRFELRSRLVECDGPATGVLVQAWTMTNVSTRAQNLVLTSYVDGDLFFEGDHRDDFGVRSDDALWQFDQRATGEPAAYLELTTEAPQALSIRREVGEYSDQRRRINRNELLREGLFRSTGAPADADGDGVTDEGFDVSLAAGHDFGSVPAGATVTMTSRLEWGVGRIGDVLPQPLAVSLGPDRAVECEGREGTLVSLEAALEPADAAVSHAWTVDGVPAGDAAALQALLSPGDHVVGVLVTNDLGATAADEVLVAVEDTQAPVATALQEIELWPPDHRMVALDLGRALEAGDACSATTSLRVLSVTSSEPDDARAGGDGRFTDDAVIVGGAVLVRRERQGGGADRVYTVSCELVDDAGNAAPVTIVARVPHDRAGR